MTLTEGSLCTGTNAIGLGLAQVLDVEPAWFADPDPAASTLLAHHYPVVPNLGDLTAVDWSAADPVDVLTAGFPCQDVSSAGRRAGLRDGNRTGLWLHIADIIDRIRPRLVVLENVRGLLSAEADSALERCPWCVGDGPGSGLRALGAVLGDLADLGFDAEWCLRRASDDGAPHQRGRVFLVARPHSDTTGVGCGASGRDDGLRAPGLVAGTVADPTDLGHERGGEARGRWLGPQDSGAPAANSAGDGWGEGRTESAGLVGGSDAAVGGDAAPDTDRVPLREQPVTVSGGSGEAEPGQSRVEWAGYEPAILRWESVLGRPAPAPTVLGRRGGHQLSARFTEWLMGLPEGWVTDVPGLTRNQQLKLCGNGVVPIQSAAAVRHLLPLLTQGVAA